MAPRKNGRTTGSTGDCCDRSIIRPFKFDGVVIALQIVEEHSQR